jgi:hypothetical protein
MSIDLTFVDNIHHASRTSRGSFATIEAVLVAEYQEWLFQGFLKRTRIGDNTTYNIEFRIPSISEDLYLSTEPEALDTCASKKALAEVPAYHEAATYSKIHQVLLQTKKSRVKWTPEEDAMLLQMRNDGCSWEDISAALPDRSPRTIRVRCTTKLKGQC